MWLRGARQKRPAKETSFLGEGAGRERQKNVETKPRNESSFLIWWLGSIPSNEKRGLQICPPLGQEFAQQTMRGDNSAAAGRTRQTGNLESRNDPKINQLTGKSRDPCLDFFFLNFGALRVPLGSLPGLSGPVLDGLRPPKPYKTYAFQGFCNCRLSGL